MNLINVGGYDFIMLYTNNGKRDNFLYEVPYDIRQSVLDFFYADINGELL